MGGFLVSLGLVRRPARWGYVGRSAARWQRETGGRPRSGGLTARGMRPTLGTIPNERTCPFSPERSPAMTKRWPILAVLAATLVAPAATAGPKEKEEESVPWQV